jgi:hypothetical protein
VKDILLLQLCRRFKKEVLPKPEYFYAMALNPMTKSVLNTFPDNFSQSIINAIQQDINALSQSTDTTPPSTADLRSPQRKKLWFIPTVPTTSTTTTSVKSLLQEWMEHPINDDVIAVCC